MDHFELVSEYAPTGDQPQAIEQLVQQLNKPTLIIAHKFTWSEKLHYLVLIWIT